MIQLGSAWGEVAISTESAERNINNLAASMRSIGTKMSLAITAPLLGVAVAAGKATAGFEQSMNQVQVVANATAGQMEQMQAVALQLGQDTSFSAGQAAEGMLELAKAGFTAQQTMDAIPGVLDLAAAGNLSVAQAAEIAANAMNAFNLPATEAGKVADLLAAAANSSSVEVTDMATAFQMSAAVFSSNQQSIEDLSAAIAILGNNGLKGSDAGTSLKTMLMRLTAPTNAARKEMDALGIAVYNSDGSMRSFQDIVGQLEAATVDLTAEQRNQALTTIFGADAIRAANILIKEGAGEFDNMKASVQEAGAAQKVADARMQGLAGAIDYARGTIESALINAFLPYKDAISSIIRQAADLIARVNEIPKPVQDAAVAFGAVLAVSGPILIALPAIGAALAALLSPIGLIVLAVAGLAAAWAADFGGLRKATEEALNGIKDSFSRVWSALQNGWQAIPGSLEDLESALTAAKNNISGVWQSLVDFFQPTVERLIEGWQEMIREVRQLSPKFAELGGKFGELWDVVRPVAEKLIAIVGGATAASVVGVVKILGEVVAAVLPHVGNIISVAVDAIILVLDGLIFWFGLVNKGLEAMMQMSKENWPAIKDAAVKAWEEHLEPALTAIKTWLAETLPQALTSMRETFGIEWPLIRGTILGAWNDHIKPALTAAKTWMTETLPQALTSMRTKFETGWSLIKSTVTGAWSGIRGAMSSMKTWLDVTLRVALNAFQTWIGSFSVSNPFAGLSNTISGISGMLDNAKSAINNFATWLRGVRIPNPFAGLTPPALPDWAAALLPGNAMGTQFWKGGLTWVGERGPELVALPQGARVYDAQESARMSGGGGAIHEHHYHMTSNLDVESVARRVMDLIDRRGR